MTDNIRTPAGTAADDPYIRTTDTGNAHVQHFKIDADTLEVAANVAMGKIAGISLTGSYATLLTMGGAARQLTIISSCDQTVLVSLDNGTTASFELDPYESISIDYACNGTELASDTIKAKHNGTVPTVGSIRASIVR